MGWTPVYACNGRVLLLEWCSRPMKRRNHWPCFWNSLPGYDLRHLKVEFAAWTFLGGFFYHCRSSSSFLLLFEKVVGGPIVLGIAIEARGLLSSSRSFRPTFQRVGRATDGRGIKPLPETSSVTLDRFRIESYHCTVVLSIIQWNWSITWRINCMSTDVRRASMFSPDTTRIFPDVFLWDHHPPPHTHTHTFPSFSGWSFGRVGVTRQ
jgi:hypothetical protein